MSNIKKDSKRGTYYFVLDGGRDPITKKRKQYKRTGFESKHEAQLALAELQIKLKENNYVVPDKVHFEEFLHKWMETKKLKLKASTLQNYQEQIRYNILPFFNSIRLSELNEEIVQQFIHYLSKERDLAPATIRTTYGILAEVIHQAAKKRLVSESVLDDIVLPRETKQVQIWNEEEINTFLNAPSIILKLTRLYIGYVVMVMGGLRMGEVLGLRWSDIDLDKRLISIRQTLAKTDAEGNYGFVNEGKTEAAIRFIYIPSSLGYLLSEHRKLIDKEQKILGDSYKNFDLVVCTTNGNFVHPNNFRRGFKTTISQLNLPLIRLYDLRHVHASYLLAKGVNIKIIQERMGHKDIKQTLNTYSHLLPSMQLEAVEKFEEIFRIGD
ncbi:site-specific integrase [Peribacillus kribbensis]|uniref:site-specific integrase n=1 Tax=Peribacillus kribbensis TaxID=356658 RepID=UPI0004241BE4|nr:site-specific integrase [Peribacillus kribbensis]